MTSLPTGDCVAKMIARHPSTDEWQAFALV